MKVLPDDQVVSWDASKQFLDNHPKSSILALANHNVLFLCIFFHFHVYRIENIPFEKGDTCHFFTEVFYTFFFTIGCRTPSCAVKLECIYPPFKG